MDNNVIFSTLGIKNKYEFIKSIVGYLPKFGAFPVLRTLGDLEKVVRALAEYNKPHTEKQKEGKFPLSGKKHKQTKLNFKL